MKTKILIIGLILLIIGGVIAALLIQRGIQKDSFTLISSSNTSFLPEGERIKLDILDVSASKDQLVLTLSISGLDLQTKPEDIENLVCDPHITTKERLGGVRLQSRTPIIGNPTIIEYVFKLTGNTYSRMNIDMDWTIGPCGIAMDNSNVVPGNDPLLTSYHFVFSLPVQ